MKAAVTVKENYVFRRMYRKGRSAVLPTMVVYCQKNKKGLSRLGVTVSTKVGNAVVRNRVRRQVRELYRLHRDAMRTGWDVIVVVRNRAVTAPYRTLNAHYEKALGQLDLLRAMPAPEKEAAPCGEEAAPAAEESRP